MLRVLTLLVCSLFLTTGALAEKRVALVIGNGAYEHAVELPNPANDAADMTAKLEKLGFTVITGLDQTHQQLEATLREFALESRDATLTLFFYSGHGMQVAGHNYIIPIDAKLEDATALDFETIDADRIFQYMGGDGRVALAFLDACRDNPLSRRFAGALPKSRSSAVGVGLALPQTVGNGLFISFSTSPGDVALDGDGRNSPFTTALLAHIDEPGLEIQQIMTRVKSDVFASTNGDQRPWTNSDLTTEVFLLGNAPDVDAGGPGVTTQPPVSGGTDQIAFAHAQGLDSVDGWEAFIAGYPGSPLRALAQASLNKLRTDEASLPPVTPPPAAPTSGEAIEKLLLAANSAYGSGRHEEAVRHFTAAVELGSAIAMGDLAYLTEQGQGTTRNASRAVDLYLDAIAAGNTAAAYNYAWMLERGEGVTRDPGGAARYLIESLSSGDSSLRQNILSSLIRDVNNLSTDTRRALQQRLKDLGLYTGGIDGSFGPASRAALTRVAEGS